MGCCKQVIGYIRLRVARIVKGTKTFWRVTVLLLYLNFFFFFFPVFVLKEPHGFGYELPKVQVLISGESSYKITQVNREPRKEKKIKNKTKAVTIPNFCYVYRDGKHARIQLQKLALQNI